MPQLALWEALISTFHCCMQIDSASENRGRGGPIFLHILMVYKCSVGFRAMTSNNAKETGQTMIRSNSRVDLMPGALSMAVRLNVIHL